ncbi:MAG: PDZ domain-containing protein [Planctomycetota bacterium]|nr:PDZ domain-containing protein [Planctomycetota bacterium]
MTHRWNWAIVALLMVAGFAGCTTAHSTGTPTPVSSIITAAPSPAATEGFLGIGLAPDEPTGGTRITSVLPGPLTPNGVESSLLKPGDVVLAIDGSHVGPDELRTTIRAHRPGDKVTLTIQPKEPTPQTRPATEAAKTRLLTVALSSRAEWAGPVAFNRPGGGPDVGSGLSGWGLSAEPSDFEKFLADQIQKNGLAPGVEKLEAYFAKTQDQTGGFHMLGRVAYGFHHPRKLPDLARAMTKQLDCLVDDPKFAVTAMAANMDAGSPILAPATHDLTDLVDPKAALVAVARDVRQAQKQVDRAFAAFSPEERKQLAVDIEALLAHQATMQYVSDSPDAPRLIRTMRATMRVDFDALLQAAGDLAGLMVRPLPTATRPAPNLKLIDPPWALRHAVTGKICATERIDGRWFVYGGPGANTYDMGVIDVVIDPGGNDVYRWPKDGPPRTGIQLIVDLAGDDQYLGGAHGGPAGARLGVSLIVDHAGNDVYEGGLGALGAGVLGVGMIVDFAGADRYTGGAWCEGAGFYGAGAILDLGSEGDAYIAQVQSQGIGGPRGCGLLFDRGGRDLYRANGPAPSVYETPAVFASFSQGIGLGIGDDLAGDDRYEAGEFAQGGAYYWGLGILHDHAGNDFYYGNRYSQGFGVHQALGALLDDQGDDTYFGMTAASQGFGWDIGMGLLVDRDGNDSYQADDLSQGSAAMQAIGWLIDLGGTDRFVARGSSVQGMTGGNAYHFKESGCLSWGMLLHAGGGASVYSAGREAGSTRALGPMNETPTAETKLFGLFIDTKQKRGEINRRWKD